MPATEQTPAPSSADHADPSVRRHLGNRAALGVTLLLAAAIGATAGGALWMSTNGLRAQAEEAGRHAAATAARTFGTLREPSAANVAHTLDIVLDDQLRAQAAATALLVETAESAGHGGDYIEDALRQIAWRSPIRRIDVVAPGGTTYSTEPHALQIRELEPAFAALARGEPEGRTAAAPAVQTATGLAKAAAAQPAHRPAAVRIEQELDGLTAAETYAQAGDRRAHELARRQAHAVARLVTHAIELAEDAGWGAERIRRRLRAMARDTTIERIAATGADGNVVYDTDTVTRGATAPGGDDAAAGRYDDLRHWVARATASRGNGRLNATVDIATRAGGGGLVETGWQTEANRLAEGDGITGVWVARLEGNSAGLAAAAPGPADAGPAGDAWTRWNGDLGRMAATAARTSAAHSATSIRLAGRTAATVRTAAPIRGDGQAATAAIVIEQRADAVLRRMRQEADAVLAAAAALMALTALATTWGTRRWLTRPIEAVAGAARCLQSGERPPAGLMTSLRARSDEIGGLARTFEAMTERVLARHGQLSALVAERTHWLQEANAKLTAANEQVEREMGLAKTVQQALVPTGTVRTRNVALASRMTPARELGGDFVDVRPRGADELFVAVCDVSGKGVAAALFMAVAQAAVAGAAAGNDDIGDVAADANRRLCTGNPLGMFVTGFLAIVDTRTGRIEYVCAGHEPPICVKENGRCGKLERLSSIPFGLEPDERYDGRRHVMDPGETVVAYTDGIPDACNRDEEPFGERRLREIAAQPPNDDPEETLQRIWTAVDLFSAAAPATDDRTCMVIRRAGATNADTTQPKAATPTAR